MTHLDMLEKLDTLRDLVSAGHVSGNDLDTLDAFLSEETLVSEQDASEEKHQLEDENSHLEDRRDELKRALFGLADELGLHANALENIAKDVEALGGTTAGGQEYPREDIARDIRAEAKRIRDTARQASRDIEEH